MPYLDHEVLTARREHREAVLEQAVAGLPALAHAEGILRTGDAATEMLAEAAELDLLLVGSRGYGPLGRVLTGSTSVQLMRAAPCAVLITPRSALDDSPSQEAGAGSSAEAS